MSESEQRKGRRSIRLRDFDYATEGLYYITICVEDRVWLFGDLSSEDIELNEFGQIVADEWTKTPHLRPNVSLYDFVVMPDHFHAILHIRMRRGVLHTPLHTAGTTLRSPSQTVGAIVRGFKAAATKRINELRRTPGLPVWQRNYYEHVIRDEADLNEKRGYIRTNPQRWIEKLATQTHE